MLHDAFNGKAAGSLPPPPVGRFQLGEELFHVTGQLETEGGASFLHASVNGVKSRPKLVMVDNCVHLFSTVSASVLCSLQTVGRPLSHHGTSDSRAVSFAQEGGADVSVPLPKYLAAVSGAGAQGGAVAPMTGTIEKVPSFHPHTRVEQLISPAFIAWRCDNFPNSLQPSSLAPRCCKNNTFR